MGKHMAGFFKTVELHEHKPLNRLWNFLLVLASFDTISLLEKYEWIWGLQKHLLRPESDVKQNVIWISLETIPRQRARSLCWNAAVHSLCSAKNENSFYTKILIRDVRFMQKIMLYTHQRITPTAFQIIGKITDITVYFSVQYSLCLCSANYTVKHKRRSSKFVTIL